MDPRRTLIADSALRVIAKLGIRGLTHLAVDTQAELPKGSTSYYCRKRVDLLRLTLQRLFALDQEKIGGIVEELKAGAPLSDDEIADAVTNVIMAWLDEPDRVHIISRFELFLAAMHEPELKELTGAHMVGMVELAIAVAESADPVKQPAQAAAILMMADGLMLSVIRQQLPTPPRQQVVDLIRSIVVSAPEI